MADKIKWREPPTSAQMVTTSPILKEIKAHPDRWALAATVGPTEVPDWWNELIFDPTMNYEIKPIDPNDTEGQREIYVIYRTQPVQTHSH